MKPPEARPTARATTILGIDPGSQVTGFGVVESRASASRLVACGASRASAGEDLPQRLHRIYEFVTSLIERYRPAVLVVEDAFYGRNVQSLKAIGQVRGVVILAGAVAGIPVYEYSPREVKKAVAGRGDASKEQVQRMVQTVLGLVQPPRPHDASDALAIALCHSHRHFV
ncbi:MAG TPA: crossover junction endodeoxyribonuclease RuvC [Candidatus Glassbacteria bacterium]|nr:crossover junction endodeoxyribonuclease RuvC [Candidatus Glassbacteria bacterium]